jgi:hypothetical protein
MNCRASVLFIGLIIGLSCNSMAASNTRLTIEGPLAKNLIIMLEMAGFIPQKTEYGDFLSLKKIDCIKGDQENVLNIVCILTDYQNQNIKMVDNEAEILFKLFLDSGAKVQNKKTLSIGILDCLDWSVLAPSYKDDQNGPLCLFKNL